MTKLGIISDTHGKLMETQRAVDIFKWQGVSTVIHCGDIGGEEIIRLFQGLNAHFVLGNCDVESDSLRYATLETGGTFHGWFGSLELDGKKIFFLHGHQSLRFDEELESGRWDLICYGHTHYPSFEERGGTLLVNPGAFQRVAVPRIAVMTLPDMNLESFIVE